MISYFTSTNVHLSLEEYHNAGLTVDETEKAIRQVASRRDYLDVYRIERTGFNSNWGFVTRYSNKECIDDIVFEITCELKCLLWKKKQAK